MSDLVLNILIKSNSLLATASIDKVALAGALAQDKLERSNIATAISQERLSKATIATAIAQERLRGATAQAGLQEQKLAAANDEATVSMDEQKVAGEGMSAGLMSGFLGVAMAAAIVIPIIVAIGNKIKTMSADYQQGMDKVQALTGTNTQQMGLYDAALKKLAINAGVAPVALTDGLYNVLSASYKGAEAMNVLTLATEDAKIGMTSSTVTTDALTNVLRTFNVQAKDVTRVNGEMLETVTLGKATFEQYASTIVKSASAASQFHVSMETMNAAWATMTSSGIRAAQASTDFQSSLKVMYGNIGTVTKALHKNGIAFDETKFNAMSYGDKVTYLNNALEIANQKHVKITGVTLQAAQAIQAISKHIGDYNANLKILSDRQAMAQKTQAAWAITQGGFNETMDRLKAVIDVIMINIGNKLLPIMTGFVQNAIMPAVQWFSDLVGGIGDTSSVMGNMGIKMGPLKDIWRMLGTTVRYVKDMFMSIVTALSGPVSGAMKGANTAIAGLINGGLLWFQGVLANVNTALFFLSKEAGPAVVGFLNNMKGPFKEVSDIIGGVFSGHLKMLGGVIKDLSGWFQTKMLPAIKGAMPGFMALGQTIMTTLVPGLLKLWAIGQSVADKVLPVLVKMFMAAAPVVMRLAGLIAGGLSLAIKFLMPYVLQAAQALANFAGEIASRVLPIVTKFWASISQGLDWLQANWKYIWPSLSLILKGVWDEIQGIVKIAWSLISGIIKIGLDVISGNWSQAWNDLKDMLSGVWDGIKTMLKGEWEIIQGWALAAWTNIVASVQKPLGTIGGWFTNLWNGIKSVTTTAWNGIVNGIKGIVSGVAKWLSDTWSRAVNTVVGWFQWLYNHNYYFKRMVDAIIAAVTVGVAWLQTAWHNTIQWIVDRWNQLAGFAKAAWQAVSTVFAGIWANYIAGPLGALWNKIVGWWNDSNTKSQKAAQGVWQKVASVFATAWSYITGPLGALWNSISNWWNNTVVSGFLSFGAKVMNALASGISGAAGAVGNALHNAINGALSGLGFHGLPGMALGGIVKKSGLFQVGEKGTEIVALPAGATVYPHGVKPEGVSSSSNLNGPSMSSSGGGSSGNTYNVVLNPTLMVPPGTAKQQAQFIFNELNILLAKNIRQQGGGIPSSSGVAA